MKTIVESLVKKNAKNESLTIEKMAKSKKTLDWGASKKNLMKVV
jgi:hypothetical protein